MFIASFSPVTGDKFTADKNGNLPFIGTVKAGKATGTLMNGTMFLRQGLEPNKLYACENFTSEEYPDNVQVEVISAVDIIEYQKLRTVLGAPVVVVGEQQAADETPAPAGIAEPGAVA